MSKAIVRNILRGKPLLGLCLLAWCLAIAAGWLKIESYANHPGDLSEPPPAWPSETQLQRTPERLCLLLFAHPRCPCTRASMSELERFLARNPDSLDACVVFTKPAGEAQGWEQTDLWQRAKRLAGATAFVDEGGVETRRFRAHTSGMAMLYDRQGRLMFCGGLTSARGHEGPSAGLAALQSIVDGVPPAVSRALVFGCPLETPGTGLERDRECRK
jgi:hypothetical protein